jgi:Flp pilus assembly protein TadD
MKKLPLFLSAAMLAAVAGCATNDQPTGDTKVSTVDSKSVGGKSFVLGSRIPRQTSDRLVRSTERDRADEPVRSLGNDIAKPGT